MAGLRAGGTGGDPGSAGLTGFGYLRWIQMVGRGRSWSSVRVGEWLGRVVQGGGSGRGP